MYVSKGLEEFLYENLELTMYYPHLFNEAVGVLPKRCFLVSGRPGLKKGQAMWYMVEKFQRDTHVAGKRSFEPFIFTVNAEDDQHHVELDRLLDMLRESSQETHKATSGSVVIVDEGHRLALSRDPDVVEKFNCIPSLLKKAHIMLIVLCDVTIATLPQSVRTAYQYERAVFFEAPNDEWREVYFRQKFFQYEQFFKSLPELAGRIKIAELNSFVPLLVECSSGATIDEIDDFLTTLKASVHRIVAPSKNETCVEDGVRVINWERCKQFMVDRGGVWCLSRTDGEAKEQEYMMSVGMKNIYAPKERSDATISNKNKYDNGGVEYTKEIVKFSFDDDKKDVEYVETAPTNEVDSPSKKRPRDEPELLKK